MSKKTLTADVYSQNGAHRVAAVQIGICGNDDSKTHPRLSIAEAMASQWGKIDKKPSIHQGVLPI